MHLRPIGVLLMGLLGTVRGGFGTCDYEQTIIPGKPEKVFNPGYPGKYLPGTNCRWTAKSDRPITLTCNEFNVPETPRCATDVVIVQRSAVDSGSRYCGTGTLTVTSLDNTLTITLFSSYVSTGGTFFCMISSQRNESDDNCICGRKNPMKIIGGQETGINEFTMMAGLLDVSKRILICGSTIINQYQVLTAAHCVYGRNHTELAVLIGDHDLSKQDETTATKLFKVLGFTMHENYRPPSDDFDIAIITIDGTMRFTLLVGPACLPFQHEPDTFAGNFVEELGWGSLGFAEGGSNVLQKIQMSVLTNRVCKKSFPNVNTRQLCTHADKKDACQFDSGGPVLWNNPTTRRLVLVGIISYGGICSDGKPSVNTRVGPFINWILTQTPRGVKYCDAE